MLSRFGDIWIDCTYIHTSDWSGSCSEEDPLFTGAHPRPLHISPCLCLSQVCPKEKRETDFLAHAPFLCSVPKIGSQHPTGYRSGALSSECRLLGGQKRKENGNFLPQQSAIWTTTTKTSSTMAEGGARGEAPTPPDKTSLPHSVTNRCRSRTNLNNLTLSRQKRKNKTRRKTMVCHNQ